MSKRGQVTIFVIIAIFLLILVGVIYFITSDNTSFLELSQNEESIEVESYVDSCLRELSRESIVLISSQGGYYQTPHPYIEFSPYEIPYYFDKEELNVPNKEKVQSELSKAIELNIENCLTFENFTHNIQHSQPKAQTLISDSETIFKLNLNLEIQTNKSQFILEEFTYTEDVELGKAIELIPKIIEEQEKQPNKVRLSYLAQLGEQEEVMINMVTLNETVFYNLEFADSEFNKDTYIFTFAMKYDW